MILIHSKHIEADKFLYFLFNSSESAHSKPHFKIWVKSSGAYRLDWCSKRRSHFHSKKSKSWLFRHHFQIDNYRYRFPKKRTHHLRLHLNWQFRDFSQHSRWWKHIREFHQFVMCFSRLFPHQESTYSIHRVFHLHLKESRWFASRLELRNQSTKTTFLIISLITLLAITIFFLILIYFCFVCKSRNPMI